MTTQSRTTDDLERDLTVYELVCHCGQTFDRSGEPTLIPDRDDYEVDNPLGTRGQWEMLRLVCPNGHPAMILTADHKGSARLGIAGGATLAPRRSPLRAGDRIAAINLMDGLELPPPEAFE